MRNMIDYREALSQHKKSFLGKENFLMWANPLTIYNHISLTDMEKVELQNRFDRKFCIPREKLSDILLEVHEQYYLLNIQGVTAQWYETIYYDTPENSMYLSHHNGKQNRYKIRKRIYHVSNLVFLEIKIKNNKGRTVKKRLQTDNVTSTLNERESEFILRHTPFQPRQIKPVMENSFRRITLVSRTFNERCTIDTDLMFTGPDKNQKISEVVVIEIKAGERLIHSPLYQALKKYRIHEVGFSKYCIGRALLDKSLKQNNFKRKIRALQKLNSRNYYMDSFCAIGG